MRYRVRDAAIIRSENAAKPPSQTSKFVSNLLKELHHVDTSLDYGSGKLRYLAEMEQTTNRLLLVDSETQNGRVQTIFGNKCSIYDLARVRNSINVLTAKDVVKMHEEIDRAFLFNVLQIIPIHSIRREILRRIFKALRPNGQLITCVQYRNSDFTRMSKMSNARPFRDGMIIDHFRGTSFYGFIKPTALERLVGNAGFDISCTKLHDGSCYIWATKPG